MIIASFTTVKPNMAGTRTYEDFHKFLGEKPKYLGVVARMYPKYTASFLTEGLGNIYMNSKTAGKYQTINAWCMQWEVDVNFVKRIPFAANTTDDGAGGADIQMKFYERYYEKDDTFQIEDSKQQCIVTQVPVRLSDNMWDYTVRLIDPTYQETLDLRAAALGRETRFLSNIKPELHETGYTKFQSNIEKHKNWITEYRVDIDQSSRYATMEDTFVKMANGEDSGDYKERIFKMPKAKQLLLEHFMQVRNNGLLFQKTTMDANGKSSILDANGRPYIAGDGVIPQINRFASKYSYNVLSTQVFNRAINTMVEKAENPTGNKFIFVCNTRFYNQLQETLMSHLQQFRVITDNYLVHKDGNKIKIGAEYSGYMVGGNEIGFMVDLALSQEYPTKGYAIAVDITSDKTSSQPAIQMFSIEGGAFKENTILGVGGIDGKSGGIVSSPVAGTKFVISGTAGVAVFTPYRSYILIENN